MRANTGPIDRMVRALLGLLLIPMAFVPSLTLASSPALQAAVVIVGAVVIVTALLGFCPLYRLLGFSTCKAGDR